MTIKSTIYNHLPKNLQPVAKRWYHRTKTNDCPHSEFVDTFFQSRNEYERFITEFDEGPAAEILSETLQKYRKLTGKETMGAIRLEAGRDYYAVVRKLQPSVTIETGVCNGLSTLSVLLGLRRNDSGRLHSIDYPYRADENLAEFRAETFEKYGGAAIPADKEPGWIIPHDLRNRWNLTIGKSQRELPRLIPNLESFDLFLHDSEHSHPCMMFEYELAYEWLSQGGVILSDDINWNDAFAVFTEVREPTWGRLSQNIGYIIKDQPRNENS